MLRRSTDVREELPSGKEQEAVYHNDTYTDIVSHIKSRRIICKGTSCLWSFYSAHVCKSSSVWCNTAAYELLNQLFHIGFRKRYKG